MNGLIVLRICHWPGEADLGIAHEWKLEVWLVPLVICIALVGRCDSCDVAATVRQSLLLPACISKHMTSFPQQA